MRFCGVGDSRVLTLGNAIQANCLDTGIAGVHSIVELAIEAGDFYGGGLRNVRRLLCAQWCNVALLLIG